MRLALIAALALCTAPAVFAQETGIAAPAPGIANYDPTMSAKEAVLANWELAAAGIRAGRIIGSKVVDLGAGDASYGALLRQAKFAQKTMVQRYNAALWVYTPGTGITSPMDIGTLTDAVQATETPCDASDCSAERAALIDAFAAASAALDAAAQDAKAALTAREDRADTVLMSEQLGFMATYLESGVWAEDLALTAFGRDGEEIAARIVGTMSLWRNIEPYVGLANPQLDAEINAGATQLLRTLRRSTRGTEPLAPGGPELTAIKEAATALAAHFRRASAIFAA
ncbi:MAG: hypothetical protein AAGK30_07765 [Pseudomonadota bacterium]